MNPFLGESESALQVASDRRVATAGGWPIASGGKRAVITRLWRLVVALHGARYGRTIAQLREALGVSRSTLYRDLRTLEDARVRLLRQNVNGETRVVLQGLEALPVSPTVLQVAALHLARDMLAPLEGTEMVRELDDLLEQWSPESGGRVSAGRPRSDVSRSALLATIDSALGNRHRLVIEYQGSQDAVPRRRVVEPVVLRLEHEHPYLFAYCHDRSDYRLFKLDRVIAAQETNEAVGDHSSVELDELLAHSVKVWLGDSVENIVIRISPAKARFIEEYPVVPHQTVEALPDGSALVRAEVTGLVEALRWVLSWGADAEVAAPKELRNAVRRELENAARRYADGPVYRAAEQVVSHSWDTHRLESKKAK